LKHIFIVTFLLSLLHCEDFISEYEYGQMLYKNPRGVSCASCHGTVGERTFIASYKREDNTTRDFYSPDIRKLDLKKFKKALDRGGMIMPKYYLTNKEIEAIYKYIKTVNQESTKSSDSNITYANDEVDDNISDINDSDLESIDSNSTLDDVDIDDNDSNETQSSGIMSKIFKTTQEEQ